MNELFFHKLGRQRYLQFILDKLQMESSLSIVLGGGIILFSSIASMFSLVDSSFEWFFGFLVFWFFGLNCLLWGMDQSDRLQQAVIISRQPVHSWIILGILATIMLAVNNIFIGNPGDIVGFKHSQGGVSGHVVGVIQSVFAMGIWMRRERYSNLDSIMLYFTCVGIPILWVIGVNLAWWNS